MPAMQAQKTIALISGANQGVGRAAAISLAKNHGYHVLIGSRSLASGDEVAQEINSEGYTATAIQLDLTSDDSIKAAVEKIENEIGALDVLVNNAGILIDYVPGFTDESKDLTTRELFRRTFETNVIGTACLTEACLPLLKRSGLPKIVFVSSVM
jgi:NAD(P)-dependent dehydrogenase (short-subunit alcohol dehydrogenase family)